VLVTLTTAIMNSPYTYVKADGSDIRFSTGDNVDPLPYWIESWDNTGTSKIWVKAPNIDAGTTTPFNMYYGNSGVSSASNGDATFVFFDDFLGTSLDTDKWDYWDVTPSVSSSVLTITNTGAGGGVASKTTYALPYIFVARAQKTTMGGPRSGRT